ncbi:MULTISPECIES: phycobilisome rod-core linker polypeptide [Cyanophyceae]|uniref:phycobilisome rod-core linker polypeptide n=1 Tax=Cyanophyceae TaxID=3028117 RepID=UPI001683A7DA|nr:MULTISPECIES: phycobilisome rod-core linker polypeptide [unclassified Phormidium]MBD1916343.1 phycobilisome linker polypeptide [Phormidium sp. FACHB-77]MBD2032635.1 phycobilisome linker polypeptide [Phormidium sp. FACHB-322]MBD2050007.1 phycobilisome linker polypeptide [Leptolyngbya sp. FACHB-60]
MPITTAASRLGTAAFDETLPVELRANWTSDDADVVIRAVYRQLLGNDYLMKSERLVGAESLLKNGYISVRDFVRAVAKSELYKDKFFYGNFQTRVIELHTKHLLGRAVYDESEVVDHLDRYETQGYDADVDSFIDSEEYQANFGDNVVPYYRSFVYQAGQRSVGFTRMFQMYRGYATSDTSQAGGKKSRLAGELGRNTSSSIISPTSAAAGWSAKANKLTTPSKALGGSTPYGVGAGKVYRIEVVGANLPRYPKVRRINTAYLVPYEQLSAKLQQIHKQGGKVTSVTAASL